MITGFHSPPSPPQQIHFFFPFVVYLYICLFFYLFIFRHGHSQDEFGIHHWSVPSILESEVGAHAVVEVYSDRLCIRGVGDIDSFVWEF